MKTKNTPIRLFITAVLLSAAWAACPVDQARAADDEAVAMIVELITGSDKDMQMMAIQQISTPPCGLSAMPTAKTITSDSANGATNISGYRTETRPAVSAESFTTMSTAGTGRPTSRLPARSARLSTRSIRPWSGVI